MFIGVLSLLLLVVHVKLANAMIQDQDRQLCPIVLTVNITDGDLKSDETISKDGISYTRENYFYQNDSIHGCVCNIKPCIRKCCAPSKRMYNFTCEDQKSDFSIDTFDRARFVSSESTFYIIYSSYCEHGEFFLLPNNDLTGLENFFVQSNGTLYVPFGNMTRTMIGPEEYCVETFSKHGRDDVFAALVCFAYSNEFETGQKELFLKEWNFDYIIFPNEKEILAIWEISVFGGPTPTLYVLADNKRIDSGSSKYEYNITDRNIFVKIRNVSENVLETKFSLFGENIYENRTFDLAFNATNLFSDGIEVHFLNETYSIVKCDVKSVLKPDINWRLCFDIHSFVYCTKPIMETESERTELQVTSYLHINSSWSGSLRCVVKNSIHSIEFNQTVIGVDGSMDIHTVGSSVDDFDESKMVEVKAEEVVTLSCAASAHDHTGAIIWALDTMENDIKNDTIVGKVENTIFGFRREIIYAYNFTYNSTLFCKTWFNNGTMESRRIELTSDSGNKEKNNGTNIYQITKIVSEIKKWIYYAAGTIIIVVVIISVFIAMKMRTYKKLQKELDDLNTAGLANFEKGALEQLNPNLTIEDQADLLPYDKRYEFPADQLTLGQQIGSGAFGVVVKGEAKGVFENEAITTVAVKMVNRNIGDIYIKALVSELKVMIHLGKHVNVVNLLGACTKSITKRELLVIVEYCRFGNLKDYLLNHRHTFVNQINAETGQIDFSIGSEALGANNPECSYITPSFLNVAYEQEGSYKATEETNSEKAQSDQDINYKGDYSSINKPVCSRDLLLWSFQIARGMEYLSSRKVLHGDLAARNILLTDGNVVKICDFGLSKKMYHKDIYKRTGDEMLPVKWMAIEAIADRIFSVQSDVWSFGIALWEIFSLARTPYPGMEYNESFCEKLWDGYRMKSPQFATQEIYEIMLHCWHAEPTMRPSFTELSQKIGSILDETIRDHYIDMNSGYIKMNAQRFKEKNADYLSMVGAPEFQKFSSPCSYVNIVKPSRDEEDTYV